MISLYTPFYQPMIGREKETQKNTFGRLIDWGILRDGNYGFYNGGAGVLLEDDESGSPFAVLSVNPDSERFSLMSVDGRVLEEGDLVYLELTRNPSPILKSPSFYGKCKDGWTFSFHTTREITD